MRALTAFAAVAALAGCGIDPAPSAPVPSVCQDQVYADPLVKDLILKGAGSDSFRRNHEDQLKYAKIDAAHRCMQQKGLLTPGGGVARPRITS
jgi:hypothetical protein